MALNCANIHSTNKTNTSIKQQVCILDEKKICNKKQFLKKKKKKKTRKKKSPQCKLENGSLAPYSRGLFLSPSFLSFHGLFFILRSAREMKAKGRAKLAGDDR